MSIDKTMRVALSIAYRRGVLRGALLVGGIVLTWILGSKYGQELVNVLVGVLP